MTFVAYPTDKVAKVISEWLLDESDNENSIVKGSSGSEEDSGGVQIKFYDENNVNLVNTEKSDQSLRSNHSITWKHVTVKYLIRKIPKLQFSIKRILAIKVGCF